MINVIKKITIESCIGIYSHKLNGSIQLLMTYEHKCEEVNSLEKRDMIVRVHEDLCLKLSKSGYFQSMPLVGPSNIVPGKTGHYTADIFATIFYKTAKPENYQIAGCDDPLEETENTKFVQKSIIKYQYGNSLVNNYLWKHNLRS